MQKQQRSSFIEIILQYAIIICEHEFSIKSIVQHKKMLGNYKCIFDFCLLTNQNKK